MVTGSLNIQRPCAELFTTSECAEIPYHPVSNISHFDEAGVVGLRYQGAVGYRQPSHCDINNVAPNLHGRKFNPEDPIA